ncbi:MAG: SDR family NAD(P)-dependent oxidoreductase [Chloroflexota bacterium]|nr:SDR family NAD(P)-dependent oxidoreductase [Chloroflexota bacterium]
MSNRLIGTTAVVTGASRGIGQAIAVALARAGAHVAIMSRHAADLSANEVMIQYVAGRSLSVTLDVPDVEQIEPAIQQIEDCLGTLDILVNNAGVRSWSACRSDANR